MAVMMPAITIRIFSPVADAGSRCSTTLLSCFLTSVFPATTATASETVSLDSAEDAEVAVLSLRIRSPVITIRSLDLFVFAVAFPGEQLPGGGRGIEAVLNAVSASPTARRLPA